MAWFVVLTILALCGAGGLLIWTIIEHADLHEAMLLATILICIGFIAALAAASQMRAREKVRKVDEERKLRESLRFFQRTLDALSAHIAILDEQGQIITVNAAWGQFARQNSFLGSDYGIGSNYLSLCEKAVGECAAEAPLVAKGIRDVMSGQSNEFSLEYPCHGPQEKRWFIVRVTRFVGAGPVRVVVAHENVSARRLAEEQSKKKAAFLGALMKASIDGILVVDDAGIKILQNQQMTDLLKIPRDIADSHDGERLIAWLMQTVKNPAQFLEKVRYLNSNPNEICRDEMELQDGTVLDRYSSPMTDDDGKYYGRIWTFRDLTERKRLESRLRATALRLQLLSQAVDQSSATVVVTDPSGCIEYVNPRFTELTGYSREEALGKTPRILKSGIMAASIYEELWSIIKTGRNWHGELCNRKKDGSLYWGAVLITTVKDEHGKITNYLAIEDDITVRKKTEESLLDANRRLLEATTQAKDMMLQAHQANRAKGEFLANMSHEIRTPMNAIIGMTGLLMDTSLSDTQRHFANIVQTNGESLLALINDILDFSKIEAGKLELDFVEFDLPQLLDDIATAQACMAKEKGLDFGLLVEVGDVRWLKGDSGRLRQVLVNLIGNALKFTARGSVMVAAKITEETPGHAIVRFTIRDTGIGIPAERQSLLFQCFSQMDTSTTRNYGGSGLGLAISKQLTEMMGGEIGVFSEQGQGSEFWFTVRLEKAAAREAATNPTTTLGLADTAEPPHSARILVVEDNATNQEVAKGILAKLGYPRVDAVASGLEALHALKTLPYDLVFMDLQMPEMDGLEATRQIRDPSTRVFNHKVPIVAMTAHAMKGDRDKCIAVGMDDYITKPVMPKALFAALKKCIPSSPTPRCSEGVLAVSPPDKNRTQDATPIFDRANLLDRMMGELELARRVASIFEQETPAFFVSLQECLTKGNLPGAIELAHALKGSSANINGHAMSSVAYKMELVGKTGDLEAMANHFSDLKNQFALLTEALHRELA